jgi:hypothetical protein
MVACQLAPVHLRSHPRGDVFKAIMLRQVARWHHGTGQFIIGGHMHYYQRGNRSVVAQ